MRTDAEPADQSAELRHAIADAVLDALVDTDCTWHQAVGEVSFILAVLLADCEDEDERRAVARMLTTGLLEVARTGELPRPPRETMQ